MIIFHVGDIHLGRKRLDGRLPGSDIFESFQSVVAQAVSERADVFLIAGDLFDRAQVEPPHLRQAQEALQPLRDAGIPVVAIEGNHDKQFVNTETPTWVQFLADAGLLILLRPAFDAEGARLEEWNPIAHTGAWVEIGGVRFTGAGYLGAATPNKVRQIVAALPPAELNVLLLHAGPEYFVGEGGGFSKADLESLKEKVCYLALGHIHKPMLYDGWACNPGSPENCDLREAAYGRNRKGEPVPRGCAVVEIDPSRPDRPVSLEVRDTSRRPVLRVELDCTPFGNKIKNGAAALVKAAAKVIAAAEPETNAVIDLALSGRLNLKRISLDPETAADDIQKATGCFLVSVDTTRLNIDAGPGGAVDAAGDLLPRDELERQAIAELVAESPLWGLGEEQDSFSALFYELKQAVRAGTQAEVMAEVIAASPLIGKISAARNRPPEPPVPANSADLATSPPEGEGTP